MSGSTKGNVPASIRQRLLNLAKARSVDFQRVLDQFVLERWLYRLSRSAHASKFVLKGAALYHLEHESPPRPTRDLDLMGWGDAEIQALERIFREMCEVPCPEDGLSFDPASIAGEQIREATFYQGVRLMLRGHLGTAKIALQVDVGFGDAVIPAPEEITFPALLDLPEPRLRAYRWETAIAEKFQAMIHLDMENSRMKDFFDIWHQSQARTFEAGVLREALRATLERRGTAWPAEPPVALTPAFAQNPDRQRQWKAFLRKSGLDSKLSLDQVIEEIHAFLWPLIREGGVKDPAFWQKGWSLR